MKARDYLEDPGIDGKTVLRQGSVMCGCGLDSTGSSLGSVAGCCEHCNVQVP